MASNNTRGYQKVQSSDPSGNNKIDRDELNIRIYNKEVDVKCPDDVLQERQNEAADENNQVANASSFPSSQTTDNADSKIQNFRFTKKILIAICFAIFIFITGVITGFFFNQSQTSETSTTQLLIIKNTSSPINTTKTASTTKNASTTTTRTPNLTSMPEKRTVIHLNLLLLL